MNESRQQALRRLEKERAKLALADLVVDNHITIVFDHNGIGFRYGNGLTGRHTTYLGRSLEYKLFSQMKTFIEPQPPTSET